ncbi:serine/threonine-protein kinase [Geminocystis sp. NIES-3709]|uniref:serine/threonine-protein kinase n=1 Tax=Geminocystis sp. NIES-3709 TaxID=1617448 RepID=UPI0005FC5323|nr:serine/threonine-protein kinase [Geminocystis sp. NIES-3709]BAQ65329.1 serine/threonine kinase [Geminocystis sp. NIES-3709]
MSYWKTGQIIQKGKYVIDKVLGAGGAGITYRAKDLQMGNIVAVKTLNATIQAQPDFKKHQERFIQEAFRLAKCSHAHVIQVDDVCQEGELWCMVMEYIDGGNLESLVKQKGGFEEVEAIRYIYQVGSALSYIHQRGILHRDVKPANIMRRSQNNEAVLIDFGLARDFIEDKTQIHTNSRTEGFAPLEQYSRNAKRGAYTDVYALAATLYYSLTLQIPFPAQFRNQGINLIPPQQHNPKISDRTNLAILKGMELHSDDRPESIAEWLSMLTENREIVLSSPVTTAATPPAVATSKKMPVMAVPPVPTTKKVRRVVKTSRATPMETETYDPLSPNRFHHNPPIASPPTQSQTTSSLGDEQVFNNYYEEESSIPTEMANPETVLESQSSSLSEVGIDYSRLEELLSSQAWRKADEETHRIMLKAVNKEASGWIDRNSMSTFPAKDLQTLDRLWLQYSNGKFGFSVQKRIYLSLGGKRSYDKKIWETVGDRLGWRMNGIWLFQDYLIYTIKAPQGHLPSVAMSGLLERGIYTLISRIMDCGIN